MGVPSRVSRDEMPATDDFEPTLGRALQLQQLLEVVVPEAVKFVIAGDIERGRHQGRAKSLNNSHGLDTLVHPLSGSRADLQDALQGMLSLKETGSGTEGLYDTVKTIFKYSVNTSSPGFLDKLYAAPLPPGIVAELVLGVLNTNLHVYQVSPVLTLIEKQVTKCLADRFGLRGPRSGGISVQGGSASNMTSIVVARNKLFPDTKEFGNSAPAVGGQLLLYTSAHGHYSVEKAAQALGFGSSSVVTVPVDEAGRMVPEALSALVVEAKQAGRVPFYVNATAGTTVLGSFDPFEDIAKVAREHGLWFHVDGAWGGSFVLASKPELKQRLRGIELADSIAINPHKMLGVPLTCSFLLGKDMKQFQEANTLKAGYLFHDETEADDEMSQNRGSANDELDGQSVSDQDSDWDEPYDLADMTLQCGRRGDALKLFLSLQYYGLHGYARMVDDAYDVACYMSEVVRDHPDLTSVLDSSPPKCLQICFYFTPRGRFTHGLLNEEGIINKGGARKIRSEGRSQLLDARGIGKLNSRITSSIAKSLIQKGFMIDFAPALGGQEERGSFFRVVVNISTVRETVAKLVQELVGTGTSIIDKLTS